MAINFTDSPSTGDTITADGRTYTYNSSTAKWKITATSPAANPTLTATASGALANGDMVIVNTDGTVSAVAGTTSSAATGSPTVFEDSTTTESSATFDSNSNKVVVAYLNNYNAGTAVVGTVSGTSISFGTPVVFKSGAIANVKIVFDSNSNKVVIGYTDSGNSSYGTAIVGTVSGTSISFGTAVVFESANTTELAATFDSNSNKVVFAYRDSGNNDYGTAIVGTVSGTSISFGTAVVYYSGINLRTALGFDSTNNKVIVAYRANSNSGHGRAQVGTVSGTGISFGSYATFNTANIEYTQVVHDSSNDKVVVLYRDDGNSTRGTAIVGTVSGTSISFGSEVVFNTNNTEYISAHFASNINKVVIGYKGAGGTSNGSAIAGTVSGTSISFGTPVTFATTNLLYQGHAFDSNEGKSVFVYTDYTDSVQGKAVALQIADSSSTNLTASNYIGVSDGAYANSAAATIQLIGSVDDAQSGLTAGQLYYIQNNGTLSTSAGSPSVLAGLAISATKLIVKGEIAAAAAAGLLVSSSGGGVTTYANIAALPSSGNTGGDLAFVTDVKAFYGWDGTEWDRVFSGSNETVGFTTSPAATYNLSSSGTATSVTVAATDPEGFPVTYGYVTNPSNQAQATITQSGGTFTVTPSTTESDAGDFSIKFTATDGVHVASATSAVSLKFWEYVNWTTFNNYYNNYTGWQFNDNGTDIEVWNNANLGTAAATHTTYTIADGQSGQIKVYYEFTTNASQGYYGAGFVSTTKTNSDNHLRDVTTVSSYPGHYGGEFSATGGATYSIMLDRNTKKIHYWKNGTYDSTRSRVMANGTYYAALGDGASANARSSATKSIIRGVNSNGTATFTYNPSTLWSNLTSGQQGP